MKQETIIFEKPEDLKMYLINNNVERMPKGNNREINNAHVCKMKASIIKIGVKRAINLVYTNVFSKNKEQYNLYTLDAQHLVESILETPNEFLRGHFVVMIDKIDTYAEIHQSLSTLNSVGKKYPLQDSLINWCTQGNENYKLLSDKKTKYGYSLNSIIECYTQKISSGNDDFKNGRFNPTKSDINLGDSIIELHQKLMNIELKYCQSSFNAIVRFCIRYPYISHEKIYNKVKKSIKDFKYVRSRDIFISNLRLHCEVK
jgi:hypothetical protein